MRALGQLLVTVSALSVLGGIGASLSSAHVAGRIRTITGLFILLTCLKPLSTLRVGDFSLQLERYNSQGALYSSEGEALLQSNRAVIIRQSLEAYIESGAADYGLRLQVQVELSDTDGCTPQSVTLTGSWTAEQQEKLTSDIAREIGIPKERQQWIFRR